MLKEAQGFTSGDRDADYGDPLTNHSCLGEFITIYNKYSGGRHDPSHDAAILQVLTKLSRIACGRFKRDNYVDLACYPAIAYECQQRINQNATQKWKVEENDLQEHQDGDQKREAPQASRRNRAS